MSIPQKFRAGDNLLFTESLEDYPASIYNLTYTLINAFHKLTLVATASDDDFIVSLSPTETENFNMGDYAYIAHVTKLGEKKEVLNGNISILPNLSNIENLDTRTFAQKMVERIEAVLSGEGTIEQKQYTINGRTLISRELTELQEMRQKYKLEINKDESKTNSKKRKNMHSLYTRFKYR